MSANPQDFGFQAGPQSPFQAAPVAPLFVRDRYGSADSTSTIGEINGSKSRPSQEDDGSNPWAAEGNGLPPKEKIAEPELPPADGGIKAWSILAGTFIFEALIWGSSPCPLPSFPAPNANHMLRFSSQLGRFSKPLLHYPWPL